MVVSAQIIEVLNYLCEKFGIAIDWSQETVLPYIQELCSKYISWEISTSITWIIIAAVFFLIPSVIFVILDVKKQISGGVLCVIGVVGIIISCVVICCQVFDILKCVYLPELQVFEYINTLVSSKS